MTQAIRRRTFLAGVSASVAALAGRDLLGERPLIASGPMLGPAGPHEVVVWLQTARPETLQLRFAPVGQPGRARLTEQVMSKRENDGIVVFRIPNLAAGTRYLYEIFASGRSISSPLGSLSFSTTPEPGTVQDLVLLTGSCFYERDTAEPNFEINAGPPEIFLRMAEQKADFMIWLGDNLYLRESDLSAPSALAARYRRVRATPELQPFLAGTRHVATWDDHDFGANDDGFAYPLSNVTRQLFMRYWPPVSTYGAAGTAGVFQTLKAADVEVFLVDDRTYRSSRVVPEGPGKTYLGAAQLAWLRGELERSTATFKIIASGSQVLTGVAHRFERWSAYATELAELFAFLKAKRIGGVVFLSGDRHWTEVNRVIVPGLYPVHDFTCSPLTAKVRESDESDPERVNPERVPGTLLRERNFGALRFEGKKGDRRLALEAWDGKGVRRFRHVIAERELRVPS